MKINTKAVFEWNPKSKQYEEIYCDSYEYDGEVAECQFQTMWSQRAKGGGRGGLPTSQFHQSYNPNPGWSNQDYMAKLRAAGGSIFNTPPSQMFQILGESNIPTGVSAGSPGGQTFSAGNLGVDLSAAASPMASSIGLGSYQGSFGDIGGIRGTRTPQSAYDIKGFGTQPSAYERMADLGGNLPNPWQPQGESAGPMGQLAAGTGTTETTSPQAGSWLEQNQGKMTGLGAVGGAYVGYKQAKSQRKGLKTAIDEIDPLKGKFMGAHERQLELAEAYRPGGKYSQYMGGQIMGQAAESAGQESQRMIASGITSPSMMRQIAQQSRTRAQHALPGMEFQMSQMALPYEQMGAESLTQYGGVVEQLASLKGARAAIDPWTSAISGGMEGMMKAGQMISSFMSPV